ncbi:MAG TPA: NUDIX domain-containing protein [Mycolicibacterium fallax]|nr:NUDIX domain-containing protein [Mycolicibacterium fallax]
MPARSAGILLHRVRDGRRQVLIVHPGGPWWAGRDAGAWSIPKGEFLPPEDPWTAARREFAEEIALPVPDGDVLDLGEVRLASGKRVHAFAVDAELDLTGHRVAEVSNTFELHGRRYPEIDRAEWVDLDVARVRLNAAQVPLLDRLGP